MPYVTEIPSSYISVAADGSVSLNGTPTLDELFGNSVEFNLYDVDANGATTLHAGDNISLLGADGSSVTGQGTYLGSGSVSFAPLTGNLGYGNFQIQVAPISGSLVYANGKYYVVTPEPLDSDHIEATVTVDVSHGPHSLHVTATAPISELASALGDQVQGLPGPFANVISHQAHRLDGLFENAALHSHATLFNDRATPLPLTDAEVFCFVAGTLIETDRGPIAVEALLPGDMILTKDHGYQPLRWVGSITLGAAQLARQPKLRAIRIKAGALGTNIPSQDLLVSPQHRVLVRSRIAVKMFGTLEVLVPAKQLLLLEGIDYATDLEGLEYFHLLFDRHQIVISNGAETESLYTGPQALRTLSPAAREEVFALFPQLKDHDYQPEAIRPIPTGRKSRKLAERHARQQRDLVS